MTRRILIYFFLLFHVFASEISSKPNHQTLINALLREKYGLYTPEADKNFIFLLQEHAISIKEGAAVLVEYILDKQDGGYHSQLFDLLAKVFEQLPPDQSNELKQEIVAQLHKHKFLYRNLKEQTLLDPVFITKKIPAELALLIVKLYSTDPQQQIKKILDPIDRITLDICYKQVEQSNTLFCYLTQKEITWFADIYPKENTILEFMKKRPESKINRSRLKRRCRHLFLLKPEICKKALNLTAQGLLPQAFTIRVVRNILPAIKIVKKMYGKKRHPITTFFDPKKEPTTRNSPSLQHACVAGDQHLKSPIKIFLHPAVFNLAEQVHTNELQAQNDNYTSFIHGKTRHLAFLDLVYNKLIHALIPSIPQDFIFYRYLNPTEIIIDSSDPRLLLEKERCQKLLIGRPGNPYYNSYDYLFLNAFIMGNSTTGTTACSLQYAYENQSINVPYITIAKIFKLFDKSALYLKYHVELMELQSEFNALSKRGLLMNILVPNNYLDECLFLSSPNGYRVTIKNKHLKREYNSVASWLQAIQKHPLSFMPSDLEWELFGNHYPIHTIDSIDSIEYVMVLTKDKALNPYSGIKTYLYDLAAFDPETKQKYDDFHKRFDALMAKICRDL